MLFIISPVIIIFADEIILYKIFRHFFPFNFSLVFSQETLKDQYEYSLGLYKQEKYFDTVTELKRLNYFDKEKEYVFQSNLLIGKAYKEGR